MPLRPHIQGRARSLPAGRLLLGALLGLLLALPIPFTNYVFGLLLLAFALGLLERDGALLIGAWVAGVIAIAVFGVLSGALATAVSEWIGRLF